MKVFRMIQGATRWDRKRNEDLYQRRSTLSIVYAINRNKLRWFSDAVKREEESMVRVVVNLKMRGKRPSQRWLKNIHSHVNGKKTSPKEILGNCFRIWRERRLERQEFWRQFYLEYGEKVHEISVED